MDLFDLLAAGPLPLAALVGRRDTFAALAAAWEVGHVELCDTATGVWSGPKRWPAAPLAAVVRDTGAAGLLVRLTPAGRAAAPLATMN